MKSNAEKLPYELLPEIIDLSDEASQSSLVLTSTFFYNALQPARLASAIARSTKALLNFVVRGEQDKAQALILKHPDVLMYSETVTDLSGRTFVNITAFKYALWALDTRYMCGMMIKCLHDIAKKDETKVELMDNLRQNLLEQYEEHESHGVHYLLNEIGYQEKHYDFALLKSPLQTYIDKFGGWGWPERKKHWCTVVGNAQWFVPAHVAQHYCDPQVPFDPTPAFTEVEFSRTFIFKNYVTTAECSWFSPPSFAVGLGVDFGIMRCAVWSACGWALTRPAAAGVAIDLEAITALCEVRTADYCKLKPCLLMPIQKPDPDPESSQCVIC